MAAPIKMSRRPALARMTMLISAAILSETTFLSTGMTGGRLSQGCGRKRAVKATASRLGSALFGYALARSVDHARMTGRLAARYLKTSAAPSLRSIIL